MSNHFRPPNLPLTTVGLALATFMQVLDTTIANVSLPTIAGDLGVSQNQSTWVITSFTVALAIGLPLTGFLGRRFGETRAFVWSTALFSMASLACGLSQSLGMLLVFRVVQGLVCGAMYPVAQSLMVSVYPAEKRGMALALISMVTVVAPIAGPILGGWITDNYSWRWIFLINVPLGIFASFTVGRQLKEKLETIEKPRIDIIGLFTLIIGVGSLQVVLDTGQDKDWFSSNFIVVASIVSAITLAIFVIWELTDKDPIVDLKLFRHRNFSAGTLSLVLAYAAFFSISLLLPLWTQRNLGYTAIWSGLATAPLGVLPLCLTFFIGKYATRVDLRWLASFSFLVMSVVCLLYAHLNLNVAFFQVAMIQLLLGLGVAFFFMPVLTMLLSDLKSSEIASGSGVATFLRTLAGSFAASIITTMWDTGASAHHARLTEHITPYSDSTRQAMTQLGSSQTTQQSLAQINGMITQQSYQMSFNDVFTMLSGVFVLLIAVTWLTKPPFVSGGAGSH